MSRTICQSCGKEIDYNEDVIEVRIGKLRAVVRYDKTSWNEKLFFHKSCNIAIPNLKS